MCAIGSVGGDRLCWPSVFWTQNYLHRYSMSKYRPSLPLDNGRRQSITVSHIVGVAACTQPTRSQSTGRTHNGLSTHLLLYCCTRHVGVVVEFLEGLRPRTLGHCFLRSRPIQHIILPDLHRHHGIGGVFFHYLCQAWSWFSMLYWPFPFSGHRYSWSISFRHPFFSLSRLWLHYLYFYSMVCSLSC